MKHTVDKGGRASGNIPCTSRIVNPAHGYDENARVDARSESDVAQWAERLGISREEFRRAAERVGPRIGDIRQHLVGGFNASGPTS
jgi:hypothetical protein